MSPRCYRTQRYTIKKNNIKRTQHFFVFWSIFASMKILYTIVGTTSLILGIIGIFLPLLADLEIGKAIGDLNYCSHIFRFPNGYMSANNKGSKKKAAKLLQEMDYTYVDWNCLNRDSERKTSNYQLLNNLKKSSKNKGTLVVLMHDTADVNNSSEILKESISYLKSEGYQFKNFYDLLE